MPGPSRTLTTDVLRAHLRACVFREGTPDRVGAEIELTPMAPPDDAGGVTVGVAASDRLWGSWPDPDGPRAPGVIPWRGGRLTREPGGQWEYSGPALESPEAAADDVDRAVSCLRARARPLGFDFLSVGLHPWADVDDLGLRETSPRYVAMQRYFDAIGPDGRRMMRLTASVQVSVDHGAGAAERLERWELAQRLAPVLTAAFANSAVSRGRPAAVPGLRAQAWLGLDPARSGLPPGFLDDPGSDPVDQYLAFALAAPVLFVAQPDGPYPVPDRPTPFRDWMREGLPQGYPDLQDWETHLSTLFPDVRPRGYLEFRAMDAPGLAWDAVPILLVGHALRDASIRRELLERFRPHHDALPDLRRRAAELALADPVLRDLAREVFEAVRRRLDGPPERLVAAYEERYVHRGCTPGEELRDAIPPGGTLELSHLAELEAARASSHRTGADVAVTC